MKKSILIVAIGALIAGPAMAADMPVKAAPAPALETWSWSGFYLGVNVGGSLGRATDPVYFVPAGFPSALIATDQTNPAGVVGGGQLGVNWQTGPVVFGIETDIQGSTQSASATVSALASICGVPCSVTETDKLTWFGTTRGRLGYVFGGWMFYATGGLAYGGVGTNGTENFVGGLAPSLALTNSTTTRTGWTAGAGMEGHLTGAWSWKVEYLHMDFGTASFSFAEPAPFTAGTITQAIRMTDEVVRIGVNYHFNLGGAVATRY